MTTGRIKGRPRTGVPKGATRLTNPEPLTFPYQKTAGKGLDWAKWLKGTKQWAKPVGFPKIPSAVGAVGKVVVPVAIAGAVAEGGEFLYKQLTKEFQAYLSKGGRMGHTEWSSAGRPESPDAPGGEGVTVRTKQALSKAGITPDMSIEEQQLRRQEYQKGQQEEADTRAATEAFRQTEALRVEREAGAWATPIPGGAKEGDIVTVGGRIGYWTRDERGYPSFNPVGAETQRPIQGRSPFDNPETSEEEGVFNPNTGEWSPPYGYVSPEEKRQQQQFDVQMEYYQERDRKQAEADKQAWLAKLRANPASWLEYASASGQAPTIQPWMLPLMPQQYQGTRAGQEIPGYQAGVESMNLPELTRPSAQYMSRISPSARQQYGGYEMARTGQTPEDISWRLWSQAPPSGGYKGARRLRY